MRWHRRNMNAFLRYDLLIALGAGVFVSVFLLTSCVDTGSDPNSGVSDRRHPSAAKGNSVVEGLGGRAILPAADSNTVVGDVAGPTVLLGYSREAFKENPIASFMYFVPLIAPTLVDNISSVNNEQQVGIISYEKKVTSKSFMVTCEFEMRGKGFHKNTFDPAGMIAEHTEELKKGEMLTSTLDYIKFEGEGVGRIEARGTITDSAETVTEVNVQFNARGRKSPVTIGLYDIKPNDGHYRYENRTNQTVARVNMLTFKKTETVPRMGVKVASISTNPDAEGFWDNVKGAIANLIIRPPKVDIVGNQAMLDFGYALLKEEPAFTFPKATNIKETRVTETASANP